MNDRTKIAERVKKLLALATSPNENEAAAAAEKAQALLLEHSLTMADVQGGEDNEMVWDTEMRTDPYPWRRPLGTMVGKLYLCQYLFSTIPKTEKSSQDVHSFIGRRANVAVAKLMFSYLIDAIDRQAKEAARGLPPKEQSPFRVSFRAAAAQRVCSRIVVRIEEARHGGIIKREDGSRLPALVSLYEQAKSENTSFMNDAFENMGVNLPKVKDQKMATDLSVAGAMAGYEAGDKIGLDQQVGSDTTKRLR